MKVYLASPLGFADSTRGWMAEAVEALSPYMDVNNPWDDHRFDADFARLESEDSRRLRVAELAAISSALGRGNEERIRSCDALLAILDGVDVDSGTASEIGFAYGLGMTIWGLRTDFRLAGDNDGSIVNLQVQYFIEASGGQIFRTLGETVEFFSSRN